MLLRRKSWLKKKKRESWLLPFLEGLQLWAQGTSRQCPKLLVCSEGRTDSTIERSCLTRMKQLQTCCQKLIKHQPWSNPPGHAQQPTCPGLWKPMSKERRKHAWASLLSSCNMQMKVQGSCLIPTPVLPQHPLGSTELGFWQVAGAGSGHRLAVAAENFTVTPPTWCQGRDTEPMQSAFSCVDKPSSRPQGGLGLLLGFPGVAYKINSQDLTFKILPVVGF